MKQNYFIGLIACAALTMTGCSNEEINAPQQSQGNNAIEFSTYLGRNAQGSRGTETNDASIKKNEKMVVLAYWLITLNKMISILQIIRLTLCGISKLHIKVLIGNTLQ